MPTTHDVSGAGGVRFALRRGFRVRAFGNSLHVEPTSTFSYTMPDRLEALSGLRTELRAWLSRSGVDRETAEDVVLAAWEVCANAVEHPVDRRHHDVTLVATAGATGLCIVVEDTGSWREDVVTTRARSRAAPRARDGGPHVDRAPASRDGGRPLALDRRSRVTEAAVVDFVGGLDLSSMARWEAEVGKAASTSGTVVLDLTEVDFLDSAGVNGLFRMLAALDGQGKRLVLVAPRHGRARRRARDPRCAKPRPYL